MALSAREAKHLATTANSLEKIVRLLQTMNDNMVEMALRLDTFTKEMSREIDLDKLVEDSKKIAEAGKIFESQLSTIPEVVADPGMRYNDKYKPDEAGRLKPYEWRHNLGRESFFDVHSPRENDLMSEEEFRIYDAGL